MLLNGLTLVLIESAPVPAAAAASARLFMLFATCLQNLPPPVATTFDGVSLRLRRRRCAAVAVDDDRRRCRRLLLRAQPLSSPTTVSAARPAVPRRWNDLLTCVSRV